MSRTPLSHNVAGHRYGGGDTMQKDSPDPPPPVAVPVPPLPPPPTPARPGITVPPLTPPAAPAPVGNPVAPPSEPLAPALPMPSVPRFPEQASTAHAPAPTTNVALPA